MSGPAASGAAAAAPPDRVEARLVVPAGHPSLPGHFPGRPVVPGVVLLDAATEAARGAFGLGPLRRIGRAKFTAPVLPAQEVVLRLVRTGTLRVAIASDAFSAEAEFGPAPAASREGEAAPA